MKYKLQDHIFYDSASGYLMDHPSMQSKDCIKKIKLTDKRKELFSILIEHRGEPVNYTELIKRLKINLNIKDPKQRVIDIVNNELLPAIDKKFISKDIIENERGVGYKICFEYECDSEGNRLNINASKTDEDIILKLRKDPWENIPDEIQYMCRIEYFNPGHGYCSLSVLRFLIDHMNDCDYYYTDVSPFDYIDWVDQAIQGCYFPIELHENDWNNNKEELFMVLDRAEELLKKYIPEDYIISGYRKKNDDQKEFNPIEKKQLLDIYYCVLYMFSEEWDKLAERLEMVVEISKRNIRQLLSDQLDAEKLAMEGDQDENGVFFFPGSNKWEPINWFSYEYRPYEKATKIYAQVYERYVVYLVEIHKKSNSKASKHILLRAEKILRGICDDALWGIYDDLDEMESDWNGDDIAQDKDYIMLIADKEKYELMYSNSEQRTEKLENAPEPSGKDRYSGLDDDIPF